MKKGLKTIIALLSVTLFSCTQTGKPTNGEYVDDFGYPLLESDDLLHDVTVRETKHDFIVDGQSEYQVIYDEDVGGAQEAAVYIINNVFKATGVTLGIIEKDDYFGIVGRSSKYIVVGCSDLFASAGKEMPSYKQLQSAGYYISSYGNSVFINAYHHYGYEQAVRRFLEFVLGFDFINEDTVIYEKDGRYLPDMEIIERPDYEISLATNNFTSVTTYGLGFSSSYPFIYAEPEEGSTLQRSAVHNVFNFIDPSLHTVYNPADPDAFHPEWFSDNRLQLCYNAHGDEESLELMVQAVYKSLKHSVDTYPTQTIINFTDNDGIVACSCDACEEAVKRDGAISGSVIRFVNKLDDLLQADLEKEAQENGTEKRTVHIQFFAYISTLEPPAVHVSEDPTLKCNPDVMVMIAPLQGVMYTKTFYDDVNSVFADNIERWTEYVDHTTAWLYETDYHHYLYPYNSYSSMMADYRFMRKNGATVVLNEGQRYNKNVTCFGKLKEYLDSKAQFDVNSSYQYLVDKFFANYFLDAADIMREYYEQMIAWETYLESNPDKFGLGGDVYQEIGSKAEYWPKQLLVNWLSMTDEAFRVIEKYRTQDPSLYQILRKHILIETMFPKYALCDLHASTYTPEELLQRRLDFKKDAQELGIVEHMEHYFIDVKYAEWGI